MKGGGGVCDGNTAIRDPGVVCFSPLINRSQHPEKSSLHYNAVRVKEASPPDTQAYNLSH